MTVRTIKIDGPARLTLSTTWPQVGLALLLLVLMFARQGGGVRFVYLFGGLLVGWRLLRLSPAAYVGFVLWLWFLTPLVRRVADLYSSWQDPSLILLTPYLVTGLSATSYVQRMIGRRARQPHETPVGVAMFAMAAAGVAVGMPFGFASVWFTAGLETLNFLTPLLFGWYIATRFEQLHEVERQIMLTFGRAAFVVGVYGIYQFSNLPRWDANWMVNSGMGSIGIPEPFGVRVFSTMHSPGVLGAFLATALVLWLAKPRAWSIPSAGVAAITLLLSQVRTAWVGFLVAGLLLLVSLKPAQQLRVGILIALVSMFGGASLLTPEMSELVDARLATFEELDEDTSAQARLTGHAIALDFAATHPLGAGIGQEAPGLRGFVAMRDSVIIAVLVQFGLIGSVLYLLGLFLLFTQLWRYYRRAASPEGTALACAGIGILSLVFLGSATAGPIGMCVWMIGGLALADRHQARIRAARVLRSTQDRIRAQAALGARMPA